MKKKILILSFMLGALVAPHASAKIFTLGLQGGLNLSSANFKNIPENFSNDNRVGFHVGPMLEICPLPATGLRFDVALLYSLRRSEIEGNKYSSSSFNIPINIKWGITLPAIRIYLFAGPYFSFNIGNSFSSNEDPDKMLGFVSSHPNWGINVGLGVLLVKHLQISLGYEIGLSNSYTLKEIWGELKEIDAKDRSWKLSLAWLF